MLIKGEHLNESQKSQVLSAFVYRRLDTTSKNDAEWIAKHAFHFTKDGKRLSPRHHYAEPVYMADTLPKLECKRLSGQ